MGRWWMWHRVHRSNKDRPKEEAKSLYNELHRLFGEKTLEYPQGVRGPGVFNPYDVTCFQTDCQGYVSTPEGLKPIPPGDE